MSVERLARFQGEHFRCSFRPSFAGILLRRSTRNKEIPRGQGKHPGMALPRTDWHSPERPWCVLPVANSQIQNRLLSLLERVQVLEIATRSQEWTTSARARPFREPCQGKMLAMLGEARSGEPA